MYNAVSYTHLDVYKRQDHLTPAQQRASDRLCEEFPSVLTPKLGLTHLLEYQIRFTDTKIVRSHPYKFAPPKICLLYTSRCV